MIPKIIHYCWFGRNPLPPLALKCIESWKKYLPDYEIKEWNEDNFDVNIIPYTREAYEAKKYAFVSDYARFWILYKYGGLYFDTDVEVVNNMDDIIKRGPFMGREAGAFIMGSRTESTNFGLGVNPGLGLGVIPGLAIYEKILNKYSTLRFIVNGKLDETTIVKYTSDILNEFPIQNITNGIDMIEQIYIYSPEYFCPIDCHTGEIHVTEKTRTIHHYSATWKTTKQKNKERLIRILGPKLTSLLIYLKHQFKS